MAFEAETYISPTFSRSPWLWQMHIKFTIWMMSGMNIYTELDNLNSLCGLQWMVWIVKTLDMPQYPKCIFDNASKLFWHLVFDMSDIWSDQQVYSYFWHIYLEYIIIYISLCLFLKPGIAIIMRIIHQTCQSNSKNGNKPNHLFRFQC